MLNSAPHDYSINPSVVNPCPDSDLRTCEPVFKPELFRCDKWEKKSGRAAECVNLGAKIGRGPEFLRLANALPALYPKDSEEKRLFDAMLVAVS